MNDERPSTPAGLDADARAFHDVREVLAGRRRPRLDGSSSKMLRIMIGGEDTEAVITPDRFGVRFGKRKQRPSQYHRRLAPSVVSHLLERASIEAVTDAVVIGLPAADVLVSGDFPRWSHAARLVWLLPAEDVVRVLVRPSAERWPAPFVQDIPSSGPLAVRELSEWAPTSPVYRQFETPFRCPSCAGAASRYRQLEDALICLQCGRSFDHVP